MLHRNRVLHNAYSIQQNHLQTIEASPLDACRSGKDYAAVLAANVVGKLVSRHKRAQ